ncbi:MAG: restriction endonuclease subunit R, partial [Crenarchaeota archaeon]|nr:restriction endonuclease subunit R [Thermoproteota archaeon]
DIGDTVEDEVMFRVGDEYQRPEDYLKLFEAFVKINPEHIEAIEVLLSRPAKWNTDVLDELREKLRKSYFSEKDLQRGHELVYKKPLADIISMVKHASNYAIPILTAQERVEKAVTKLIEKHSFTDEQFNWLSYIKEHLIENLAISQDDFEIMPVFERRGGLNKARQIFGKDFETMIQEINASLVA